MTTPEKKRVLVALDGSAQSRKAAGYVCRTLSPKNTEVVLYHVLPTLPEPYWDLEKYPGYAHRMHSNHAWVVGQKKLVQKSMDQARKNFLQAGFDGDHVRAVIQDLEAGVARDIAHKAQEGFDCLVVGRTGASKVRDVLIGSTAMKLMGRMTGVPLWIIGGNPEPGKYLVGVDGSEGAEDAVRFAARMLAGTRSDLFLVHVKRAIPKSFMDYLIKKGQDKDIAPPPDESHLFLDRAEEILLDAGFKPNQIRRDVITEVSSRAAAMVERAVIEGCGTLVVGRRGLSRVEEFFMGRVSQKVIQMAKKEAVWVVS